MSEKSEPLGPTEQDLKSRSKGRWIIGNNEMDLLQMGEGTKRWKGKESKKNSDVLCTWTSMMNVIIITENMN